MKKKILIYGSFLLLLVSSFLYSCSSYNEDLNQIPNKNSTVREFDNMVQFKKDINPILKKLSEKKMNYNTKAASLENKIIDEYVQTLIVYSRDMLSKNGVNVDDIFVDKNDPRIAIAGLTMVEYQEMATETSTKSGVGNCLLEAMGIRGLFNSGVKAAARQIARMALKKAVPYVGWGLAIADFSYCMYCE